MVARPGLEAPDRNLALELVRVTEAALDPLLAQLAGSPVLGMLTRPLSCRVRLL